MQELKIGSLRSKSFADFKLDSQGIRTKEKTLPWQAMQEFSTKDGIGTILKKEAGLPDNKWEQGDAS